MQITSDTKDRSSIQLENFYVAVPILLDQWEPAGRWPHRCDEKLIPAKFNTAFAFDLRTVPFETELRFVVFTGGPLSGKTSVLESLGVPFEPEVARVVLERELVLGKTKNQIRGNEASFQRSLDETKLQIELSRP